VTVVGFDFGTTNSLISVVRGSRVINYLDNEGRPIPSIVCYQGAQKIVGRAAKERLAGAGLGVQGNIVRSPKMYLGREGVFVEGVERNPIDIVADVVRHVLDTARTTRRRELGDISGAVVTIPVGMDGKGRRALRDAFRLAGLSISQVVHEPLAALYGLFRVQGFEAMLRQYDRKLLLVFDWGGGTLDLTLCRLGSGMVVQIMNDGTEEVGGDVFDEAIMNSVLQNDSRSRSLDEAGEIQPGAKQRLLDRCERAKIDLSSRSNVQIYVPGFYRGANEEDLGCSLGRDELEQIVGSLLAKGFKRIEKLLENAGYTAEQIALCVATGGMANMPAVRRRLNELFGPERVRIPDQTATLIAEGAAWIASDESGLRLAKNVELGLARNSYLPLVKGGTRMPTEGQVQIETFHLYCTDPRDGIAKFQICSPKAAGARALPNEPRTHLENLTVRVDAQARAFQERLELDVQINDDLILAAHARSLNARGEDRCEIHNLEFGLAFPVGRQGDASEPDSEAPEGGEPDAAPPGALSVRANVASRVDPRLVPGEYLYSYDPWYFDERRRPPDYQVFERLYYEPCALCGRASNDPACRC
jgi:hypothetical protein